MRLAAHDEATAAVERARLFLEGKRRKRKKRRKRRTPRTSSHSSRNRARLRQRQWHTPGWFYAVHAVFPSFFDRPKMLGFWVGMDQKDRYAAWLRPRSSPTSTVALSWLVLLVSCCVSLRCPEAQDARHLVRYGPEGQFHSEILASRLSPWYLAVTFSACLAGGTQELDFLGDDFDEFLYSAQCLVRQRIHPHASDHGGSGVEVAALAVDTGSGICFPGLLVRTSLALCSLWLTGS